MGLAMEMEEPLLLRRQGRCHRPRGDRRRPRAPPHGQVELFDHPHLLLLQVRNSSFKLPGGRLRTGEQDVQGLKRKLSSKLSVDDHQTTENGDDEWQIAECIGVWWRSEFEAIPFPYLPPRYDLATSRASVPDSRQYSGIWSNHIWNSKSAIEVLLQHHQ